METNGPWGGKGFCVPWYCQKYSRSIHYGCWLIACVIHVAAENSCMITAAIHKWIECKKTNWALTEYICSIQTTLYLLIFQSHLKLLSAHTKCKWKSTFNKIGCMVRRNTYSYLWIHLQCLGDMTYSTPMAALLLSSWAACFNWREQSGCRVGGIVTLSRSNIDATPSKSS